MINKQIESLLLHCQDQLMIPADRCATVWEDNNLLHALMLLSSVGYSEIPVLNTQRQSVGSINMPLIMGAIKTETAYLWDQLSHYKVSEVMRRNVGLVKGDYELEDVLHAIVDHNYIHVTDENGVFIGIITRKEILGRVNFLAHQIDSYCDIYPHPDMNFRLRDLCASHGR